MPRFEMSVVIERPIEAVFAHLAALENKPWPHNSIVGVERITPDPVGLGTQWRMGVRIFGVRRGITIEAVEFEANRRIAFKGSGIGAAIPWLAISLEGADTGTRVTYRVSPRMVGPLGGVAGFFLLRWGKRDLGRYFAKLKEILESRKGVSEERTPS